MSEQTETALVARLRAAMPPGAMGYVKIGFDDLRALLATLTALRAEVADARRAALLEAAKVMDAEAERCGVLTFTTGIYCHAAALLRARAATPAPPATDPRDARIAALEKALENVRGWLIDHHGCAWSVAVDFANDALAEPQATGSEEPQDA